jgi:predicted secreted protein
MDTLVRGYGQKPGSSGLEDVKMTQVAAAPPTRLRSPDLQLPAALGGAAIAADPVEIRRIVLWSCLVAAVLLLVWMAWRLLSQMETVPRKDDAPVAEEREKDS